MDHLVENTVAAEAINKVLLGVLIQQTKEALSQKLDHQNPTLFLQLECLKALLQKIGNGFEYQPTMPPDSIRGSLDRTRDDIQLATFIIYRSQKRRRCIDFIACIPKTSREIREWTSTFDEQFQDLEMDLSINFAEAELQMWLTEAPNVAVIGVYGVLGVGKTSLLKIIYNTNKVSSVFDFVIWVTLSQEFKIQELQCRIGHWICREVGIGFGKNIGTKVVFSTHNRDLALMEAEESIEVQRLSRDEGWELFERIAFKGGHSPEE
eukprot:PITA_08012